MNTFIFCFNLGVFAKNEEIKPLRWKQFRWIYVQFFTSFWFCTKLNCMRVIISLAQKCFIQIYKLKNKDWNGKSKLKCIFLTTRMPFSVVNSKKIVIKRFVLCHDCFSVCVWPCVCVCVCVCERVIWGTKILAEIKKK